MINSRFPGILKANEEYGMWKAASDALGKSMGQPFTHSAAWVVREVYWKLYLAECAHPLGDQETARMLWTAVLDIDRRYEQLPAVPN